MTWRVSDDVTMADGGPRYRDAHGKEHAGHFPTRAAAQAWLDQKTTQLVTGTWVEPRRGK